MIKKIRITGILAIVFFFSWIALAPVSASVSSQTLATSTDFQAGTADYNVEINQSPGDVKLKQNKNTYTETTVEDFNKGHSDAKDAFKAESGDGEIVLGYQSWKYTSETVPAIGTGYVRNTFLDEGRGLLYLSIDIGSNSIGGLYVIDTKKTLTLADDTLLIRYADTSTPAIGSASVHYAFLDDTRNLLYICTRGSGGLSVVNTQGTIDPTDDVLVKTYNTTSTPAIGGNDLLHAFLDERNNLLYVSTSGNNLSVINTQGTIDPADDVLVKNYNNTTAPAILAGPIFSSFIDPDTNLLYINGSAGLSVINTQGTVSPDDDTLLRTYTTTSTPAIGNNQIRHSFFDANTGLLYVSTGGGGLSVINTQKNIDPSDDELVVTYTTTSTPAIGGTFIMHSFLDKDTNLLYISDSWEISVIDTKGTIDPSDDVNYRNYSSVSSPAISSGTPHSSFMDKTNNLLYVSEYGGSLSIINLNEKYYLGGTFVSQVLETSKIPQDIVSFPSVLPEGTNVSIQTRVGSDEVAWVDNADNNDASNMSDYYSYGYQFNNISESNGVISMTEPQRVSSTWMYLNTGKASNYFPAKSRVTAKIRYVGEGATNVRTALGSDDWESASVQVSLPSGEWKYASYTSNTPLSIVEIDNYWNSGTWNNSTDRIEIDWVKIELPDTASGWEEWSPACTNQYGCPLIDIDGKPYLQYKINLTTENENVTPSVNSVVFSSGYADSGIYTSKVIDASRTADWKTFSTEQILPLGTNIIYQTRSGQTPVPDSSWSSWQEAPGNMVSSPSSRYLQFQITLNTSNQNQTPVLSSITVNYELTEIKTIPTPTAQALEDAVTQGFIVINGEDPTNTEHFTFTTDTVFIADECNVVFPANTQVTNSQGGNLDLTQLSTSIIKAHIDNEKSAIKIGIPNLNLSFSNPITIVLPIGKKYNNEILDVVFQREGETDWNDETTCKVINGNCTFSTTHATTFAAIYEAQKAHIDSWKAYSYEKPGTSCVEKIKLEIKGKHFDKDAEVKIGNKKAFSVERKSSKEIVAKFCLEKLFDVKVDSNRVISVINPEAKREKAQKRIDLSGGSFTLTANSFNFQTNEGIKNIQRALIKLNYLEARYLTGNYGSLTQEAVRKFQADNGIEQTGYVESQTKDKLEEKMK